MPIGLSQSSVSATNLNEPPEVWLSTLPVMIMVVAGRSASGSYALNAGFWAVADGNELPTCTDAPLAAGTTPVKAVHVSESRQAIAVLRARYGLIPFVWTDAPPVTGVTQVMEVHLTELRAALDEVYAAAAQPLPIYTHATLTGGATVIPAVDIAELRAAILAIW